MVYRVSRGRTGISLQGTSDEGACPQGEIPEARRVPVDAVCSEGTPGRPGDRVPGTFILLPFEVGRPSLSFYSAVRLQRS